MVVFWQTGEALAYVLHLENTDSTSKNMVERTGFHKGGCRCCVLGRFNVGQSIAIIFSMFLTTAYKLNIGQTGKSYNKKCLKHVENI